MLERESAPFNFGRPSVVDTVSETPKQIDNNAASVATSHSLPRFSPSSSPSSIPRSTSLRSLNKSQFTESQISTPKTSPSTPPGKRASPSFIPQPKAYSSPAHRIPAPPRSVKPQSSQFIRQPQLKTLTLASNLTSSSIGHGSTPQIVPMHPTQRSPFTGRLRK